MFSIMTRRIAIVAALLGALVLAGCGDKEPEQRKAFISFLQTRVVDQKSLRMPLMSAKDKEDFGPYVAHYQIIQDFNTDMTTAMKAFNNATSLQRKLTNIQGLQENWKEVDALRVELPKAEQALSSQYEKAQAARAALKQPDDLKAVYDKAFAKLVTNQAEAIKAVMPPMERTFQAMVDFGRFLTDNKDKLKISGMMVDIQDPALRAKFQQMQQAYMNEAQGLMAAVRPLMTMIAR